MWSWVVLVALVLLIAVAVYDVTQRKRAILRNFPIVGHFRYWLEAIGPELRQYIITSNDEERPFSRDERRWVYASSKGENNLFGFGTDNNLDSAQDYLIIKHAMFPLNDPHKGEPGYDPDYLLPCAKVLGEVRGRAKAFRPTSLVNVSAMSFGSLSGAAIEALNKGAQIGRFMHNTGEGGVSPHHRQGGDLVWQLGTGYFGCRDPEGRFNIAKLKETLAASPTVRALEIKLSQGAKPSKGGILPAAKVTPEIAAIRGVPMGQDCISPSSHSAFRDADSLLDFVEQLAQETGLPVGIKAAVGELGFWHELAALMVKGDRGVDFITIDGGEGGTGAAPLSFADHVALPFKMAISRVYPIFWEQGLADQVVFIGSGRLGFPQSVLWAMALGCDMVNVAREAMMAIGCIQAQQCHTGRCPTGVATQDKWLVRGLDPTLKAARAANYVMTLRKEVMQLSRACGVTHPALLREEHLELVSQSREGVPLKRAFGYGDGWGTLLAARAERIDQIMRGGQRFGGP
jgi:glutamate synthase domain-containing protein 2